MLPKIQSDTLFKALWENSVAGIALLDANNIIVAINPAYTEIMGFTPEEVIGQHSEITRSGFHPAHFYQQIWEQIQLAGHWAGEIMIRRKNGEVFSEWLVLQAITDEMAQVTHYLAIISDITERKTSSERIRFLANNDPLTKLPNYISLVNQLDASLKNISRTAMAAVFSIGIDNFRNVNASCRLEAGDKLLQLFADRLQDGFVQNSQLGRVSGDKFVVVIFDVTDKDAVNYIAQSILVMARRPFIINHQKLTITASIGISLYPENGTTSDNLLKNAETALFQAKSAGRDGYQFFTEHMRVTAEERFALENTLRLAVENHEFELFYHPIVSLKTREIASVEALIRWNRPGHHVISPDKFIPVAEDSGLIVPITEWVLSRACQDSEKWQQAHLPVTPIAVNISPRQFLQKDFKNTILGVVQASHISPSSLKLEITESLLMRNTEEIIQLLTELRNEGIRISIDDFGTGYSSFQYLKQLPVDDLKIDKFFIRDIDHEEESKAIVISIINLAKALNIKTIAEGVETAEQVQFLREQGCDYIQGFYFSKPVPAQDLMKLLMEKKRLD